MHMPGHKRNPAFAPGSFMHDITEIDGLDDLHDPHGVILNIEKKASLLYSSDAAYISVNGSTALIISAILSTVREGQKAAVMSNCHISVWHALETGRITPVIIDPDMADKTFAGKVSPHKVREVLEKDPEIKALVITSPTYDGILSDTQEIKRITEGLGVSLITDAAHGAHLGLKGTSFPPFPSGDLVITSLHKTLHSPTQTAVMLSYGKKAQECSSLIRHYLSIFESSSPSYVLMEGIDRCLSDMLTKEGITASWEDALSGTRKVLDTSLKRLRLLPSDDPSKIVIGTLPFMTGYSLASVLRDGYGIEIEAAYKDRIIAMTGIGDTAESLGSFTDALIRIDGSVNDAGDETAMEKECIPDSALYSHGSFAVRIADAVTSDKESVHAESSAGRTSAEFIFAYPPGIPALIPGEVITKEKAEALKKLFDEGEDGPRLRFDPMRNNDGCIVCTSVQ